jgi:transcriptional regulator with XRE-family HTH domain
MKDNNDKLMAIYKKLIDSAATKRKETIAAKEVADRMEIKPTVIYRLEKGTRPVNLLTLIAYLQTFGYTLAIVPNKLEIVPNPPKKPKIETIKYDLKKMDRKQRLRLLKFLIAIEEAELGSDDEE